MNILIICTYYPPDTAIAGKRPYYFAKYLTRLGHKVTVIRSGKISTKPDKDFYKKLVDVEVISYYGKNSQLERYERGELNFTSKNWRKFGFLSNKLRDALKRIQLLLIKPFRYKIYIRNGLKEFYFIKKTLDSLKDRKFDIVFSSYGDISNAYAGEYAKSLFNCKWIMDFRDLISAEGKYSKEIFQREKYILEDYFVKKADFVTTVSLEGTKRLKEHDSCDKFYTLYNGYELNDYYDSIKENEKINEEVFSMCFTGIMYQERAIAFYDLILALSELKKNNDIDIDKIRFYYAGPNCLNVRKKFKEYGIENAFVDMGFLSKKEVFYLQKSCDVFLAAGWNTKLQKGVISGKFYEGIQNKKPIIFMVSGDEPYSEMYIMNEKYKFGYTYESCRKDELYKDFCSYILSLYNQKIKNKRIEYNSNENLLTDFRYDNLTKQLEKICFDLVKKK